MLIPRRSLLAMVLLPLLVTLFACGPGAEPTPTPTLATPTATPKLGSTVAPTPTATSKPGPIATPAPTLVATPTPTPAEQPRRGGRLGYVASQYPPNYDPQIASVGGGHNVWMAKLYSNIFVNYEGDSVACEICESWNLENGGKTLHFKMLKGIKFHNGKEMKSADVVYSLKMLMGDIDGLVSPRAGIIKEYIDSIQNSGDYEFRINLAQPSVFVTKILALGNAAIYPEGTTREGLQSAPAGSGPFLLKQAVQGVSWTLERNPNYFKGGLPYLDGADITIVVDETTSAGIFLTGKTLIRSSSDRSSLPQFAPTLRKLVQDGKLTTLPIGSYGPTGVWINVTKPPMDNLKVRQALNLVIDRVGMGNIMYKEYASPQLLFFTQGEEYARPASEIWNVVPGWGTGAKKQQEVEAAKKLVIDAGYPNGIDIKQMTRGTTGQSPYNGAEPLQQALKGIGIRTTLDVVTPADQAVRMANLDYLFQVYRYLTTVKDPDEVLGQYWITGGARNNFGYSNKEVDRLFVAISSELDPIKRKQLYRQVEDIIVLQDVGYAPLSSVDGDVYWWNKLGGFQLGFSVGFSAGLNRADHLWLRE